MLRRVFGFMPLWSIVFCIVLWEIVARVIGTPLLFPEPMAVLRGMIKLSENGELWLHTWASLERVGIGLLVGVPLGTVMGCAMGASREINAALDPYVRMANSTPAIALIPFALIWFGLSESARYALVVYIVILTVALNARQGVAQVPRLRLKAAHSLGVGGVNAFFRVVIPSSMPSILAGIRTATGLAVIVVVAAEMLGATTGLGFLIILGRQNYDPTLIFIGIFGLGIMSIVLDRGMEFVIERFMPRWSVKRRV
jgi:ABC-type nitrate/sulfonate/bicarbonate transport system permease component